MNQSTVEYAKALAHLNRIVQKGKFFCMISFTNKPMKQKCYFFIKVFILLCVMIYCCNYNY